MQSPFNRSFIEKSIMLLLATGLLAIGLPGCKKVAFQSNKKIPAGLRAAAPAKLSGKLVRAWGGDNFEFGQQHQLHYIFLIGVDCPEPGQPFFNEARNHLLDTCLDQELELDVLEYDELKREISHAWRTKSDGMRVNLAIDLLSRGLAWYDGNEFEDSGRYRDAMDSARSKKLGLWSQPNPTPPWEYWKRTEDAIRGKK